MIFSKNSYELLTFKNIYDIIIENVKNPKEAAYVLYIKNGKTILLLNPLYVKNSNKKDGTRAILYARVSSSINKASLDGQIKRIRDFASEMGYTVVKEVKEIASGLNDERPKFLKLISSNDWDVLIVEHKDRLTRFGFNCFNPMLNKNNQKIEVINEYVDKSKNQELTEDLIAIITSFCGRFHGANRKEKTNKIINEIKDLDK